MSSETHFDSWSSPNEYIPRLSERNAIAELELLDFEIGEHVSRIYRKPVKSDSSFLYRLFRRLIFECQQIVKPFLQVVKPAQRLRRGLQLVWKRRVKDGTFLHNGDVTAEVHSLTDSNLSEILDGSNADFWILTREPDQLLTTAVKAIFNEITGSQNEMWFGDSQNSSGEILRRTKFNRLLLRQVDALGAVIIVRLGRLRNGLDHRVIPPELWPLALGLTIPENLVQQIPFVLGFGNHTIADLDTNEEKALELVNSELSRSDIKALVEIQPMGRRQVVYRLEKTPVVSIVIPTRGTRSDGGVFLVDAVTSILARSTYSNIEFVIVADDETPQDVVDEIDALGSAKIRWIRWAAPFNFSQKMNLGAVCANGDFLLMLNDDIELVTPDWIERMLSLIGIESIQYVGALLFFSDQTIQHAGHFYRGGAGHIAFGKNLKLNKADQIVGLDRITSGVTAACSLISKNLYLSVGGFSPLFPGNYNDVDLSLKVGQLGFQCAVAGGARLYHFESKSRDATVRKSEVDQLFARWGGLLMSDLNHRDLEN